MTDNPEGKPPVSEQDKEDILRKLEPYLKVGLSINKACLEALIPKSTVYDLINEDTKFAERIAIFKQFGSILVSNAMMAQLRQIIQKQNPGKNKDGNPLKPIPLTSREINFLKWYALHSNVTRDEFTQRSELGLYDPESEIKRLAGLMDKASSQPKKDESS